MGNGEGQGSHLEPSEDEDFPVDQQPLTPEEIANEEKKPLFARSPRYLDWFQEQGRIRSIKQMQERQTEVVKPAAEELRQPAQLLKDTVDAALEKHKDRAYSSEEVNYDLGGEVQCSVLHLEDSAGRMHVMTQTPIGNNKAQEIEYTVGINTTSSSEAAIDSEKKNYPRYEIGYRLLVNKEDGKIIAPNFGGEPSPLVKKTTTGITSMAYRHVLSNSPARPEEISQLSTRVTSARPPGAKSLHSK